MSDLTAEQIKRLREEYLLPSTMTYFERPLNIVRGQMQYVYDDQGRKYLDAFSAVVTISVGHCHPEIVPKMQKQVAELQHMTTLYYHPTIVQYAKKLADMAGGDRDVSRPRSRTAGRPVTQGGDGDLKVSFFTNSGCEANELAAMLAKNYTHQQEFIALRHSFHGRTLMAMTMTGQSLWRHSMPYVFGVTHAPAAYCYRCPLRMKYPSCGMACAHQVEDIIKYNTSGKIAGFIGEPISGFGGVIHPPKEYFPIVYDIVRKYGGVCIADEVQTGFGRTGKHFFGITHWGVKADIVTMAKGIGNGVPLGGIITTRPIAESMRGKVHFNTYGGNPVSMAAGLGVLEVIERHRMIETTEKVGGYLKNRLQKLMNRHPMIGEVRGLGLMLGAEMVKDRKTKEPASKETLRLMDVCKDRGLLIGKGGMSGNVVRIKPPMCITQKDADFIVDVLDESIGVIEKESRTTGRRAGIRKTRVGSKSK